MPPATAQAAGSSPMTKKNPKGQKVASIEMNIGCEACHGPGAAHVTSRKKKDI